MANLKEARARIGSWARTGKRTGEDMLLETRNLMANLYPHDRSLKARAREAARHPESAVSDWETLDRLITTGLSPDAFYHNAGSADYDIPGKRYQRALSDNLLRGIEFDVHWCLGHVMGAHGHGPIAAQWLLGNINMQEAHLPRQLKRAEGKFDRYNLDLKVHNGENIRDVIELIKTLPEGINVFVSSPNWKAINAIAASDIDRPLTLLYTVNNETPGTTTDAFVNMIQRRKLKNSENRRYGVSLRSVIATPTFIDLLKQRGFYSLLYTIDSNNELLRAMEMGADGVTSNNPKILQLAELAKRFKEGRPAPPTPQALEAIIGKDTSQENQLIKLSDGRNLGFAEYGDVNGEPVFFFHGWPNSRFQGKILDEAAQKLGLRIVSPDRRGYGLSDKKSGSKIVDWANDMVELANYLGIDRFSVLGNSGGGPYAAACAAKIPERVNNVGIVVGLAPITPETTQGMPYVNRWAWKRYPRSRSIRRAASRIYELSARLPGNLNTALVPKADRNAVASREAREERQRVRREAFRKGADGAENDLERYTSEDWGFNIHEIGKHIKLWYGGVDKTVPHAMGRYYEATLPQASLTIFPDEGHYVLRNHPEEILAGIKD